MKRRSTLKKHIVTTIIFVLLAFFLFYFYYMEESNNYYNEMIGIEKRDTSTLIVVSENHYGQTTLYDLFTKYLDKYEGNLFCRIILNESDKRIHTTYVYYTDSQFMQNIRLDSGRLLDVSENESDKFLSTLKSCDSKTQTGRIAYFPGDWHFEIRTIKSYPSDDLFERILAVDFKEASDIERFIEDLGKEGVVIQKKFGSDLLKTEDVNPFIIIMITSFILLMLILFYRMLRSYKQIAVEKMLGLSNFRIWYKRILPIAVIELITIVLASSIMIAVSLGTASGQLVIDFLIQVYFIYGLMFICSIVFLSTPILYIRRVSITNMLKNRKPVKGIIIINTLVKTGLIVLFLVLSTNQYTQLLLIKSRYANSYDNWENTKEYAVISNIYTDNPQYDPYSIDEKEKNKSLYYIFNSKGAVYADFYSFLPDVYEDDAKHHREPYKLDYALVNPNYLKLHNISDINGKTVEIDEGETSYILLVPEKYHHIENEILDYYQFRFNPAGHNSEQDNDVNVQTEKQKEKEVDIKVIWIENGQSFFTYNLEIKPNNGNCVKDPIVRVLTENNGELVDYNMIAGYMTNPFKIKVADPNDASAEIIKELKKYYELSDFHFTVKSQYDVVEAQIQMAKSIIQYVSAVMVLLAIMIAAIIFHNVFNYYEHNRMKLAIQRFHGYKAFDKLKGYLFGLYISYAVILPAILFIYAKLYLIFAVLVLLLVEIVFSIIVFLIVEKRNILKITKGG